MLLNTDAARLPGIADGVHHERWGESGRIDPVVVVIEDEGDGQLLTDRKKVVGRVADLVVLQD
jgi:hypothetical protein